MGNYLSVLCAIIFTAFVSHSFAQPQIEVPLRVTDGSAVQMIYFGIESRGFGCCEFELPPIPPEGVFDTRFICPRIVDTCGSSWRDIRPFTSTVQRDTFRFRTQMSGVGTILFASWPSGLSAYFTQLTLRYFNGVQFVVINMLTDTSVDFSDVEPNLPAMVNIFSGGLVATGVERDVQEGTPEALLLFQNYPNPFNPSTAIKFTLPRVGHVTLKIYDLLGTEVATLVNELLGPGTYERTFDAEGLASGVYFYRTQADGFIQTRKLLLLR
jgi:hypothetical protein